MEDKNKQALAKIDEAIATADKNLGQGDLGFMLAQNKENGVKLGMENLSRNINKMEESMQNIANSELDKPHPDTNFNQDSQLKKIDQTVSTIEGKMEDIHRFYINLQKEDDEYEVLQAELGSIKEGTKKNKQTLAEVKK